MTMLALAGICHCKGDAKSDPQALGPVNLPFTSLRALLAPLVPHWHLAAILPFLSAVLAQLKVAGG